MPGNNPDRLAKRIKLAGRVIGLCAVVFFLSIFVGEAIFEILAEDWEITAVSIEGILIGVLGLIALIGCILSWWRERLASILLISTAVGFGIHIAIFAERNYLLTWLIIGLPYLISGGLLYVSWQLSKEIA
ncbi:MAG: hypothetical protein PHQ86_02995 [Dehalococcoidales bacterium]|nr:hypothetical protein [Dehalococcoidales bacterium]